MSVPRKFSVEFVLNTIVVIAFGINACYLFATDNPPKWVKFVNAFG